MKDVFLKIIKKWWPPTREIRTGNCATEIADMVKAFVEWLTLDDNDFYPQINNDNQSCYWDCKNEKEVDFNYVFNYWYNEIREN